MFSWIIEPAISLSLFYLAYALFLRNVAFFHANRLFLLTAIIFSFFLPHISLSPPVPSMSYYNLIPEVTVTGTPGTHSQYNTESWWNLSNILMTIYICIAVLLVIRLIIRLVYLFRLVSMSKTRKINGSYIVSLESGQPPFSFLNYIFINEDQYTEEEKQKIIEHEQAHINQYHTLDLLLLEVLTIIQWFNPVSWLYRKSLLEIHEYIADKEVIEKGTSIPFYQSLLLDLQFGKDFFAPANNFSKSLTVSRIKMMTTIKPPAWKGLRFFILLPAITMLVFMCTRAEEEILPLSDDPVTVINPQVRSIIPVQDSINEENSASENLSPDPAPDANAVDAINDKSLATADNEAPQHLPPSSTDLKSDPDPESPGSGSNEVFFIVEEMPGFRGGGQDRFRRYIAENLRYPQIAAENGIEGRVFVQFIVKADGTVNDANIVRGVDSSLDKEALRVIMSSPPWTPGKQRGRAVDVAFTFPINFVLQQNPESEELADLKPSY